jgi:hypothetical protein
MVAPEGNITEGNPPSCLNICFVIPNLIDHFSFNKMKNKINKMKSINPSSTGRNAEIVRTDTPPFCVCEFLMVCHFVYRKKMNVKKICLYSYTLFCLNFKGWNWNKTLGESVEGHTRKQQEDQMEG